MRVADLHKASTEAASRGREYDGAEVKRAYSQLHLPHQPHRAVARSTALSDHRPVSLCVSKLDLLAEAAFTDTSASSSQGRHFMYDEAIQRQGYTA